MAGPALVWFRDDYRLADNPALTAAVASGAPVLCFFILDRTSAPRGGGEGLRAHGGAACWWLHGSLGSLDANLRRAGSSLLLLQGPSAAIIDQLVEKTGASAVFWNRRYSAAEIRLDGAIKQRLVDRGIQVRSFSGRLLHEPWEIRNQSGRSYQVFTPYLRTVMGRPVPVPLPAPKNVRAGEWPKPVLDSALRLKDLKLEPTRPNWAVGLADTWERGEAAARARLSDFLDDGLRGYAEGRDRPAKPGTSRLSPHLRFGEISPRQVWYAISDRQAREHGLERDVEKFLAELVWRDFCCQLLHDHPHLPTAPHDPRFERFPWIDDQALLSAWRKGRTGYPIVDAGMRQLWRTGWMHNRVRMIAASFLVKHLLADWRQGEAWFWDTLVDADAGNNAFSWQWIAGSGPDSAPFHRIFNPVTQGEKFDPEGDYIRAFVPELGRVPSAFIHKPWEAPPQVLASAGITLDETYPAPVVPHGPARERALAAFRSLRDTDR